MTAAALHPPTRTLVVDDDPGMRELIHLVVDLADEDVEVAAEAACAEEALERWHAGWRPDVLVVDFEMPGRDGLDLAEELLAEAPELPIILLSASLDAALVRRADRVGVRACLPKVEVERLPGVIAGVSS